MPNNHDDDDDDDDDDDGDGDGYGDGYGDGGDTTKQSLSYRCDANHLYYYGYVCLQPRSLLKRVVNVLSFHKFMVLILFNHFGGLV